MVHRRLARVLLTQRTGETAPHAITALWKDRLLGRLELQPLSAEETLTLMHAVLDGPVDAEPPTNVVADAGQCAVHAPRDGRGARDGGLFRTGGQWRWRGDAVVSAGLADLISSRLDGVNAAVADVLDLLAVSEPLDLAVLSRLADPVVSRRSNERPCFLTTRIESVEVRLAHPLYREASCPPR